MSLPQIHTREQSDEPDLLNILNSDVYGDDAKLKEAIECINELVADFGDNTVLAAILRSSLAQKAEKLGAGEQLRLARIVVAEIVQARNRSLHADLVALALGFGDRTGITLTEIATQHAVCKATASHALTGITDRLGLGRIACQISDDKRKSFRELNKRNI